MPTTRDPRAAYTVGQQLLQCATGQVSETWADEADININRSCVVWGEIAWDDCECGQLVVAINDQWPSDNFPRRPADESNQSKCGPRLWVVQYFVSILRCAPVPDDMGNPPSCEELSLAAEIAAVDSWAVRSGVGCCLRALHSEKNAQGRTEIAEWQVVGQETSGPEGGCAGSVLTVNVGLLNCFCPDEGGS